jgi:large subunit ribosomal protein L35
MNVVPDMVALPYPEIDLSVSYPSVTDIVPGKYVLPSQVSLISVVDRSVSRSPRTSRDPLQTVEQPQINLKAFTNDATEQLYTLVMVDPDFPDPENLSFKEYCHWIV